MPLFVCLIISDDFQINGLERFSIECRKAIAKNQREILKSQWEVKGKQANCI